VFLENLATSISLTIRVARDRSDRNTGKTLTANQIQFVNLVIDYLTQSGWMSAAQLYESPFTDFSPKGVEGVFGPEQVLQMVGILNDIRERAAV
jgi:type I restriction enzyme, R subunit